MSIKRKKRSSSSTTGTLTMLEAAEQRAASVQEEAASSGDGGLLSRVVSAITDNPVGRTIGSVLDVIDTPRAFVMSSVAQLEDIVSDGEDWDWSEWWKEGYNDNIGADDILREKAEEGDTSLGGAIGRSQWGSRLAGLLGDVALDPLTYVGGAGLATKASTAPAGALLEAGARAGTKAATREATRKVSYRTAARIAREAGETDIANKVLKNRSINVLSEAEKATIGVRSGLTFAGALIPGSGGVARSVAKTTGAVGARARRMPGVKQAGNLLDPLSPRLERNPLRLTDPIEYLTQLDATRVARGLAKSQAGVGAQALGDAVKAIPKDERGTAARHLLDSDTAAVLRDEAEQHLARVRRATGESVELHSFDEHFALHDDVVKAVDAKDMTPLVDAARRLRQAKGDRAMLYGVTIKEASAEELRTILKRTLGLDWRAVARRNPTRLVGSYHTALERGANRALLYKELERRGVITPSGAAVVPTAAPEGLRPTAGVLEASAGASPTSSGAMALRGLTDELPEAARTSPATTREALTRAQERFAQARTEWEGAADSRTRRNARKRMNRWAAAVDANEATFDGAGRGLRNADAALAEVQARAAELRAELPTLTGHRARRASEELSHQERAEELYQQAGGEADEGLAAVARLEASAAEGLADQAKRGQRAVPLEGVVSHAKANVPEVHAQMQDGFRETMILGGIEYTSSPEVARAMQDYLAAFATEDQVRGLVQVLDTVTAKWKAYTLLTPGYHSRNAQGAIFSNALAGVKVGDYVAFLKAHRQWKRAEKAKAVDAYGAVTDPQMRDALRAWHDNGGRSQIARDLDAQSLGTNVLALVTGQRLKGEYVQGASRRAAEGIEYFARGPLFTRRYIDSAGSIDEALDAVATFHFDYAELSLFEKKFVRRIIPFATWMRKNLPLQLENMVRQPGKYQGFLHAKRNLELGVEEEPNTPSYVLDMMGIRTPWHQGDSRVFLTLDLPFRDLGTSFAPSDLAGSANPLLRAPIELMTGERFSDDGGIPISDELRPADEGHSWLLGILGALPRIPGLPHPVRGADGEWLVSGRDEYKLQTISPQLGHLRRLTPDNDKDQRKALSSYLSIVAGISTVTVTDEDQRNELYRRIDEASKLIAEYEAREGVELSAAALPRRVASATR